MFCDSGYSQAILRLLWYVCRTHLTQPTYFNMIYTPMFTVTESNISFVLAPIIAIVYLFLLRFSGKFQTFMKSSRLVSVVKRNDTLWKCLKYIITKQHVKTTPTFIYKYNTEQYFGLITFKYMYSDMNC